MRERIGRQPETGSTSNASVGHIDEAKHGVVDGLVLGVASVTNIIQGSKILGIVSLGVSAILIKSDWKDFRARRSIRRDIKTLIKSQKGVK